MVVGSAGATAASRTKKRADTKKNLHVPKDLSLDRASSVGRSSSAVYDSRSGQRKGTHQSRAASKEDPSKFAGEARSPSVWETNQDEVKARTTSSKSVVVSDDVDHVGSRNSIASEVSDAISSCRSPRPEEDKLKKMSQRFSQHSAQHKPDFLWHQRKVRKWYEQPKVQIAVAALIFLNFIVSAINAQFHLDESPVIYVFELFFNACFTVELIVNMYGNWFFDFWSSAWNVFDFVIVWISLISMIFKDLPGITVLRLFRAFRVFRLFKRIKNLRVIIEGVLKSLPGVCNAFFVLSLIMSIWAIMAVDFFREDRPVEFGDFVKAVVTFFQMMTYDSWCSGVARDLILEKGIHVAVIFISYMFVNAIMMTNVVVAVLLDKFINVMESRKEQDEKEGAQKALVQALDLREEGLGNLASLREAYEKFCDLMEDGANEEDDELVAYAEDVLRQEEAEPAKLNKRWTQVANEDDVEPMGSRESGVHFGAVETLILPEEPPPGTQGRAAEFQANFIQDLKWMLRELDGLEQDISFLEGSLPQPRASPAGESLSAVQRVEERSVKPLGEAAPQMDGPRHAGSSDVG
mmetsp:Transcript_43441/g.80930  ORF Transcript_43441/g.80930 Transcript_43441/m.80930 type:complete len:578 (-) Transcript_43441:10-1743(-)